MSVAVNRNIVMVVINSHKPRVKNKLLIESQNISLDSYLKHFPHVTNCCFSSCPKFNTSHTLHWALRIYCSLCLGLSFFVRCPTTNVLHCSHLPHIWYLNQPTLKCMLCAVCFSALTCVLHKLYYHTLYEIFVTKM